MVKTFYDVLSEWSRGDWDIVTYSDIVAEIGDQVGNAGHLDTPLGAAISNLWDWFDEMLDGMGLIMADEEQQAELKGKLDSDDLELLHQIEVDISTSPELKVTITNIEELKKTGNPEAVKKAKSDLEKMFDDLSYGGGS
ncbi:MAG: hypothetical protein ACFFF4_04755 [Candidatus Thorarchaeota archaeon]